MTQKRYQHKGWYSRGYLPHYDSVMVLQSITFRLADSLPAHVVSMLVADDDSAKQENIEEHLNAGYGACYLRDQRIGGMVESVLLHFDNERYRQIAWVIMPNHVHTLIQVFDEYQLSNVVHSWKSFSALQANRILGRSGPFWYRSYFDRYIRNEKHFWTIINYIHQNPVKAGLIENAEDWVLSSSSKMHYP